MAWKHGGHDPYRLYNKLDESYRPLGRPDAEPRYPPYPWRVANVIYGFAVVAEQEEIARAQVMAGLGAGAA